MTRNFDPTKPVRLRNGQEAVVFTEFQNTSVRPLLGLVKGSHGDWYARNWRADGRYSYSGRDSHYDLVNITAKRKRGVWLNVYKYGTEAFATKDVAEKYAEDHRLDCVYVEFEYEEPS